MFIRVLVVIGRKTSCSLGSIDFIIFTDQNRQGCPFCRIKVTHLFFHRSHRVTNANVTPYNSRRQRTVKSVISSLFKRRNPVTGISALLSLCRSHDLFRFRFF